MASKVWADITYRSKGDEEWQKKNGYVSDIHAKNSKGKLMSKEATSRANHCRLKVRSKVEHASAHIKWKAGLFIWMIRLNGHTLRSAWLILSMTSSAMSGMK